MLDRMGIRRMLERMGIVVERSHLGLTVELRHLALRSRSTSNFFAIWRDWIDPSPAVFAAIYEKNRSVQKSVPQWIDRETVEDSLWRYGFPRNYTTAIEEVNSVDRTVTYTDLLASLGKLLKQPRYLEIGVSTGKNFYQISKQLADTVLAGIDIEAINPSLEGLFTGKREVWQTATPHVFERHDGQVVEKAFSLTRYADESSRNEILYLSGDKFSPDLWSPITDSRFNLIFSDACHEPRSLHSEVAFMLQFGVIDPRELIMIWDDLDAEMTRAFFEVTAKLSAHLQQPDPYVALFTIPGTYGGRLHKMGLFASGGLLPPRLG